MSHDRLFDLPAHHIYRDGSVSRVRVSAFEGLDCTAPHISYEDGRDDIITLGSTEQARALAHALLIAADLCDKVND